MFVKKTEIWAEIVRKAKTIKKTSFIEQNRCEFLFGSGKSPKIEDKWFPAQ